MNKLTQKMQEAAQRVRRVAVYAYLEYEDMTELSEVIFVHHDEEGKVLPEGETRELPKTGYVRISEIMEISLIPLQEDVMVGNAVASLEESIRETESEAYVKVRKLKERKSQLLALEAPAAREVDPRDVPIEERELDDEIPF